MATTIIPRVLIVAFTLFVVIAPATTYAKAAFAGKAEMIKRSVAIAVVDITAVEEASMKGNYWTYGQQATATVKTALKGPIIDGAVIQLYGQEDFICARCDFKPGRQIVFLTEDRAADGTKLWIGSNWHLSIRPITTDADKRDRVEWFKGDDNNTLVPTALADVLADVKRVIASHLTAG